MTEPRVHPDPAELSAFGLGQLDEAETAAVAAHLADCPECLTFLESVRADGFIAQLQTAARSETTLATAAHDTATWAGPGPPVVAPVVGLPPELAAHPRYRVVAVLGAGGMGTVYKAEHQLMERPVALKVINHDLTRDPAAVARFRREVKAAARLSHPNIVTAHDAEQAGDLHLLVMEFVEGTTLDRVVAAEGPLPVARACAYARQAALALQHAHEKGMVHRDVKPHNLIRTPDGTVKVLDFGLARFARESALAAPAAPAAAPTAGHLTEVGALMGTPDYLAPEQAVDPHTADVRADLYSLGCTLYFLLTGRAPFAGITGLDKIMAHLERAPEPLSRFRDDVPPGLAGVIDRLLAKSPAQRYPSPAEAAQALEPFTQPAEAPDAPAEAALPPRRGGRLRLVLGGLGGAAGLTGLVLLAQVGEADDIHERLTQMFNIAAVLGGTLLLCQFLLSLVGFGHHHDVGGDGGHDIGGHDHHGHDHDVEHETHSSWFIGVLTFRTLVAALVFFGLTGRAALAGGLEPWPALAVSLAAAAAALFGVAWMMRLLYRLRADGTVRVERAVGRSGTVYLSIPGHRSGVGKVLLNVQNRTVEYQAVTAHEALPTGTPVTVLAVVRPDTVEVAIATPTPRNPHV